MLIMILVCGMVIIQLDGVKKWVLGSMVKTNLFAKELVINGKMKAGAKILDAGIIGIKQIVQQILKDMEIALGILNGIIVMKNH
jgi:hypothetical protein